MNEAYLQESFSSNGDRIPSTVTNFRQRGQDLDSKADEAKLSISYLLNMVVSDRKFRVFWVASP